MLLLLVFLSGPKLLKKSFFLGEERKARFTREARTGANAGFARKRERQACLQGPREIADDDTALGWLGDTIPLEASAIVASPMSEGVLTVVGIGESSFWTADPVAFVELEDAAALEASTESLMRELCKPPR